MSSTVSMQIEQEVRLAVVLYGGVSLAIYINGVTQELFHLVRATAVDPVQPDRPLHAEVTGTERVYRQLGQMLGSVEPSAKIAADGTPVRTKFVVDILSGTSAGGINAIYLAKALANDQDFGALQRLWYDEGDIARLLNDTESDDGVPKVTRQAPKSLLNSARMYYKLLEAFEGMDGARPATAETQSPYADEIDLFVTTTDLRGLPLSLRLADRLVAESRHRKVFHLRYDAAAQCNDFVQVNNPFLAYVARCTSSFPFAFEPMQLKAIEPFASVLPEWAKFFPEDPSHYVERPFADGGYLDNKPFSYAIDTLGAHRAAVPIDRKLLYVEPSPEHPEDAAQNFTPPNAIENVIAFDVLAHDETIREDLQRVLGRNQLLERVDRFLSGMEDDLLRRPPRPPITGDAYAAADLARMIENEGIAYGGYHRLKVSALTEWLAQLVACAAGIDLQSDDFIAVRCLMRAWRDLHYAPFAEPQKATQNRFLLRFDLAYRIRRLEFVLHRLDDFAALDDTLKSRLAKIDDINQRQHGRATGDLPNSEQSLHVYAVLSDRIEESFRTDILAIRDSLSQVLDSLRRTEANLKRARGLIRAAQGGETDTERDIVRTTRGPKEHADIRDFVVAVMALELTGDDLHAIVDPPTDAARLAKAAEIVAARSAAVDAVADALASAIGSATETASARCAVLLDGRGAAPQEVARHYYFRYEQYDLISFPVLYSTDASHERDAVEVIRVSPEDATSIVDERRDHRQKLAGTALMHFGAFLERSWRTNDLLWGRLDGAERLISTLLSGTRYADCRDRLVGEAQAAILEEHFGAADRDEFCRLYTAAVLQAATADANVTALGKFAADQLGTHLKSTLETTMRSTLDGARIREFLMRAPATVDRKPNPEASVRDLARSTEIIGRMLEGIAADRQLPVGPATWLTRLGRILWGLVEVSVPRSVPALLFRYGLHLLYLFDILLIAVGFLFNEHALMRVGVLVLAATFATHMASFFLADVLQGRVRRRLAVQWLAGAGAALIVGAAAWLVARRLGAAVAIGLHNPLRVDARFMALLAGTLATVMTVAGGVMAVIGWFLGRTQRPHLPRGLKVADVALALADGPADVMQIAGPNDDPVRDHLRAQTDVDFVVIAAYLSVLLALSAFSIGLPNGGIWLGAAAVIAALATALSDVWENFRLYALLDASGDVVARLKSFRRASLLKWGALFVTAGLLGAAMLCNGPPPLRILGGWFALTAVVGLVGVARRNRAIEIGFFMLLVAFAAVAAAFAFWPEPFLAGF